jgi:hypothetical protein
MSTASTLEPSHDQQPAPIVSADAQVSVATRERQTYQAQCHCGLITFAVTISPPLTNYNVMQCNCSICTSNGYLLVYPYRSDVVFYGDSEKHAQKYRFYLRQKDHWFCSRCGTSLLIDFNKIHPKWDVLAVNVSLSIQVLTFMSNLCQSF